MYTPVRCVAGAEREYRTPTTDDGRTGGGGVFFLFFKLVRRFIATARCDGRGTAGSNRKTVMSVFVDRWLVVPVSSVA